MTWPTCHLFRDPSRCYPWAYRPALLRLLCADEICIAQRTLSAMSLQVQDGLGKMASSVQPMRQEEPLDEKMITAPKIIARELAACGGQAMPLLEGNQATLVTSQIIV